MEAIEEELKFRSGVLSLAGVLAYPAEGEPRLALLLLAPHPHLGGRMDNNVIRHVARRAAEMGCATLRFDYRGVGDSEIDLPPGRTLYDHWSELEREQRYADLVGDACAACEALVRASGAPRARVVFGYSLGAILAALTAPRVGATHVVAVSPPVARVTLEPFRWLRVPKLFVAGDRDFAFDRARFVHELARVPEPKR